MFGNNRKRKKLLAQFGKRKDGYFHMSGIESYATKKVSASAKYINDRTCHDLDMNELFMFADRCSSSIGQQLLLARLRGVASIKSVEAWESQIERFKTDDALKEKTIIELDGLNDGDAYYLHSLFHEPYLEKPTWYWVIPMMSVIAFLSIPFIVFIPNIWIFSFLILTVNFIIHYWNKQNLLLYSRTIPHLLGLIKLARNLSSWQSDQDSKLAESIVRLKALSASFTLFKIEKGMQSEVGQFADLFIELIKAYFLLEPITLFKTLKRLEAQKADIERLFDYVAEKDLALAVGALRDELPHWCRPKFESNSSFNLESVYHPLLPEPVSNSLNLANKSLLLTGSNMSGKTTFIRTLGISVLCAQAINTCFCKSYAAPPIHVSSAIRISDDIMSDKSYFQEEMLVVKSILNEANNGTNHLFLLDELMKGTNTLERVAAGKAILDQLAKNGNLVIVATHDLELADLLKEHYELYHFSEVIETENIQFDYLLKPGKLTNTNAIRILEINDYPRELTEEARRLVAQMKRD